MAEAHKISLGVRSDSSVVHVDELDEARERGLECGCTCSACGDRLVAKLGAIRQHHFAHYSDQLCTTGNESALHRFAKKVFQFETEFRVPQDEFGWGKDREVSPARYIRYTAASLEQPMATIVPDIILVRDSNPAMLVEIRVTHAVDIEKSRKLSALGLPCIEIDLSQTHRSLASGFNREAVKQLLIHGDGAEKQWVYNPERIKYEEALKEREQMKKAKARRDQDSSDVVRQRRLDVLMSTRTLEANEMRKESSLACDLKWQRNCHTLGIPSDSIPDHLNIKVPGEYLFLCHRAVWQSSLFIPWVFKKREPGKSLAIPIEFVFKNLQKFSPDLLNHELVWAFQERPGLLNLADVVGDYFTRLVQFGFVIAAYQNTLNPPYKWEFLCRRQDHELRPARLDDPQPLANFSPWDLPPPYDKKPWLYRRLSTGGILDRKTGKLVDHNRPSDHSDQ
jgi:hypothetical protein